MAERISTFALTGPIDAIPEIPRMDSILKWLYDLAGQQARLVVLDQQGVATMAAYRGGVMGFDVHVKPQGILDDLPRLAVIVCDDPAPYMGMLAKAISQGTACYVLPLVKG